jgi:(S)-2-hydroxyglutarate dehydrogenase
VEHAENSTHILNAVSPGFTSSLRFARYVLDEIDSNR